MLYAVLYCYNKIAVLEIYGEPKFISLTILEAVKSKSMVQVSAQHLGRAFLLHHYMVESITW